MGWETRAGNEYYYRKQWVNGKCVSEYIGTGEVAGLLARLDKLDRIKKEIEAKNERKARAKIEEIDHNFDELEQKTKDLVETFLIERGFYKTSSREWRLKAR